MTKSPVFNQNEVIYSFRLEKLQNQKLCAFLEKISYSEEDQDILDTWMAHFTNKRVPWAVTQTIKNGQANLMLWKIDEFNS